MRQRLVTVRAQESRRLGDPRPVDGLPPQPGVLEHILGIGGRAQHPIGDAEESPALLLELVELRRRFHPDILQEPFPPLRRRSEGRIPGLCRPTGVTWGTDGGTAGWTA